MNLQFRPALREDVPGIIALLREDRLGQARETLSMDDYLAAFDDMAGDPNNQTIVGWREDGLVATYQFTVIPGLSLRAARRAQIEGVRVTERLRSHGIGRAMFADVERRALAANCALIQLTMNQSRTDSAQFYTALGFTPSHIGYKRDLS